MCVIGENASLSPRLCRSSDVHKACQKVSIGKMATYGALVAGLEPVLLQPLPNSAGKFIAAVSVPAARALGSATERKKRLVLAVWRAALEPSPPHERADVFLSVDSGVTWLAATSLTLEHVSCVLVVPPTLLDPVRCRATVPGHVELQIGVSVEDDRVTPRPAPAAELEQVDVEASPTTVDRSAVGDPLAPARLPQALARDLYRFLQSFDTALPECCSTLLDRWLQRVEHRFAMDPSWWQRVWERG
ncbi:hypothetical protein F1559_003009 [Cyanidiococcus yangmingshanensis]|uniref:Uncharacterized protein n=1 Tax=Cyanidiococcus yangmingshanensis TaxID=2690220 RepID=A0A7J7IR59_9RHOD|nr:hypothetical protein F1559_003009 [Cyanidiococcus yangmingshanensis]